MKSEQLTDYLNNKKPIQKIELNGQIFWLKQASKPHSKIRYWLMDLFAKRLGSRLLRAIPNPGGSESISIEKHRLTELHNAGINVPYPELSDQHYLLLPDQGLNVRSLLKATPDEHHKLALLRKVIDSLTTLHKKGFYLSQAFARNITVDKHGNVGYIDFEDDPLTVLSLEQAQARDLLLFVSSTAYLCQNCQPAYVEQIGELLQSYPQSVHQELRQAISSLRWLRTLAQFNWLGRDIQRHALMLDAFEQALKTN